MGFPSIAIDHHGTPYVAFEDDNGGATVFKFNAPNHSWDTLGSAGFNFSNQHNGAQYTSLTITPNDSIYIAFQNGIPSGGSPAKAVAAKFTGNGWSQIGNAELSFSQADYIKIAVDGSGTPFVAFADNFYDRKLSIMKYGTATGLLLLSDNDLIQVAPNPVQSSLQVTVPKSAAASITLLDINGKAVAKNRTTGTGIETISVNSLSAGVYLLVYEYSGTKIIKRIIKE